MFDSIIFKKLSTAMKYLESNLNLKSVLQYALIIHVSHLSQKARAQVCNVSTWSF
jgi:hypothetical protein